MVFGQGQQNQNPPAETEEQRAERQRSEAEANEREREAANAPSAAGDGGAAQVDEAVHADEAKGFHGSEVDPTPNENYTFGGNDLPTPETDSDLAVDAMRAGGRIPAPLQSSTLGDAKDKG